MHDDVVYNTSAYLVKSLENVYEYDNQHRIWREERADRVLMIKTTSVLMIKSIN